MKTVPVYSKLLLAILLFIFAFWGIHYTADWEGYNYAFYNTEWSRDIAFSFLSDYFYKHGLVFRDLFHFHIILMAILYTTLYKALKVNPISFVILTIFMGYVGLGNQIRYYVALPLALIACFYLYKQKYVLSIISFIIALLFHSTVIIVFSLFIFMTFVINRVNKKSRELLIVLMNIVLFLIIYKSNFMMEEQYETYKNIEKTSSFAGGLFNLSPLIIPIYFLKKIVGVFQKDSAEIKFLYTLLISTLPLFLLSIYMQITGSRMMMALLPFYICFFYKCKKLYSDIFIRRICLKAIVFTLVYFVIWRFFVPLLWGVNGAQLLELQMMIRSYSL